MASSGLIDFNGTDGTELSAHDSNFTRHPSYSVNSELYNNRLIQSTTGNSAYTHNWVPTNADYTVDGDLYVQSTTGGVFLGVLGRVLTASDTHYMWRYFLSPTAFQLYVASSGSYTQLGSDSTLALTVSTAYAMRLEMIGDQIAGKVGGVYKVGPITNGDLTAKGLMGLRSRGATATIGYHLDNMIGADPVAGDVSIVLSSSIDISDSDKLYQILQRIIFDELGVTDSIISSIISVGLVNRVLSDSISISDAVLKLSLLVRALQSATSIADSIVQSAQYNRVLGSSFEVSDDIVSIIERVTFILLSDSLGVQDSTQRAVEATRGLLDAVSIVDSILKESDLLRILGDDIGLSDSIVASIITSFAERVLSDNIDISDSIIRALLRSEHVTFIVMSLIRRDIDFELKLKNILMTLSKKDIDNELN